MCMIIDTTFEYIRVIYLLIIYISNYVWLQYVFLGYSMWQSNSALFTLAMFSNNLTTLGFDALNLPARHNIGSDYCRYMTHFSSIYF